MRPRVNVALSVLLALFGEGVVLAQVGTAPEPARKLPVEKIGENLFRIGEIRVDMANREVTLEGVVNPNVLTLEFIANARGGARAYESAFTLDTDPISFNTALVLIGLDRSRARGVPTAHFDPAVPEGDAVEIWIECPGGQCARMPVQRVMFDRSTNAPISGGAWIYTGSTFLPDGRYLAELDGSLVGFVHDPASIIEFAQGAGLSNYGAIGFNPHIGLDPGTRVRVTLRAIPTRR